MANTDTNGKQSNNDAIDPEHMEENIASKLEPGEIEIADDGQTVDPEHIPSDMAIDPEPYASIYDEAKGVENNPKTVIPGKPLDTPSQKTPPIQKEKSKKTGKGQKFVVLLLSCLIVFFAGFFAVQYGFVTKNYASAIAYQKEVAKQGSLREDVSALQGNIKQEELTKEKFAKLADAREKIFNESLATAIGVINAAKGEIAVDSEIAQVREIQDKITDVDKLTVAKIEKYSEDLDNLAKTLKEKLDKHLEKKKSDYAKAQQQNSAISAQLEKEIAESRAKLEAQKAAQAEKERIAAEKKAEKDRLDKEQAEKEKAEEEANNGNTNTDDPNTEKPVTNTP